MEGKGKGEERGREGKSRGEGGRHGFFGEGVDAHGKRGEEEGEEGKGRTPQCLKCIDAHASD